MLAHAPLILRPPAAAPSHVCARHPPVAAFWAAALPAPPSRLDLQAARLALVDIDTDDNETRARTGVHQRSAFQGLRFSIDASQRLCWGNTHPVCHKHAPACAPGGARAGWARGRFIGPAQRHRSPSAPALLVGDGHEAPVDGHGGAHDGHPDDGDCGGDTHGGVAKVQRGEQEAKG